MRGLWLDGGPQMWGIQWHGWWKVIRGKKKKGARSLLNHSQEVYWTCPVGRTIEEKLSAMRPVEGLFLKGEREWVWGPVEFFPFWLLPGCKWPIVQLGLMAILRGVACWVCLQPGAWGHCGPFYLSQVSVVQACCLQVTSPGDTPEPTSQKGMGLLCDKSNPSLEQECIWFSWGCSWEKYNYDIDKRKGKMVAECQPRVSSARILSAHWGLWRLKEIWKWKENTCLLYSLLTESFCSLILSGHQLGILQI